jgi:spore germination protein YaaH
MDNIDATVGAYYLKAEGSDTWTGNTANANAFIKTRSLQTVGIYPGRLSDGGTYITFNSVAGTLSGAITGPTGSGTIVWYNENPNNRIAKISGYTGSFTSGETWTTSGGSGIVNVIETIPDEKTFLQSRGIKCFLYITNYNFDIGDFDGALSNVVVNYPSGYIPSIVNTIVNDGWDGANIDIENVYQTDGTAAINFIVSVADALHAVRKLIHVPVPAKTNTPYDNPAWTGWCDYNALLKRVDAIHVMTYLESGDDSAPAPHAPQAFWNLVYNYIITTVPARLRCKILVGCHAYAHVWDDTGAGSYQSFWDALAMGLLRGALIETKEGESTWSAHDFTAWMGVTDTHRRAVEESIKRRFHGIGSWKMDDGNRLTYFPKYPQLGRSKL